MNSNCSNLLDMRNLQEQVKKAFCYRKLFWPFTVWINCSSDLKNLANSRPSASNFKSFPRSQEQFFLTVGQNNFGNKIPIFPNYLESFRPQYRSIYFCKIIYGASVKHIAYLHSYSTSMFQRIYNIIVLWKAGYFFL